MYEAGHTATKCLCVCVYVDVDVDVNVDVMLQADRTLSQDEYLIYRRS